MHYLHSVWVGELERERERVGEQETEWDWGGRGIVGSNSIPPPVPCYALIRQGCRQTDSLTRASSRSEAQRVHVMIPYHLLSSSYVSTVQRQTSVCLLGRVKMFLHLFLSVSFLRDWVRRGVRGCCGRLLSRSKRRQQLGAFSRSVIQTTLKKVGEEERGYSPHTRRRRGPFYMCVENRAAAMHPICAWCCTRQTHTDTCGRGDALRRRLRRHRAASCIEVGKKT